MPIDDDEDTEYNCGTCDYRSTNEDDYMLVGDDLLCEDCRSWCNYCEEYCHNESTHYVEGVGDYCESCWENHTHYCERCSCTYSENESMYNIEDRGEYWCEGCYEDNGSYCDECDTYYFNECNDCNRSGSGRVMEYNDKPEPIFHGYSKDNLYFGLELEMEISDNKSEYNSAVQYVSGRLDNDWIYLKSDSSIGRLDSSKVGPDGFEMVSHPASLDYWSDKSQDLWDTLDGLRTHYNARSWNAKSNCGIHIHISRAGFKSGAHTHRFLALVYKNTKYMKRFAGRDCNRYATFTDVWKFDEDNKPYMSFADKVYCDLNKVRLYGGVVNDTERMSAVNTRNLNTIELRFFRGTTKPKGVLATIELAHAMVEYTRNLTLSDVKLGMLDWEWFVDYIQVNNGLYPNAYARIPELDKVRLDKPELINA